MIWRIFFTFISNVLLVLGSKCLWARWILKLYIELVTLSTNLRLVVKDWTSLFELFFILRQCRLSPLFLIWYNLPSFLFIWLDIPSWFSWFLNLIWLDFGLEWFYLRYVHIQFSRTISWRGGYLIIIYLLLLFNNWGLLLPGFRDIFHLCRRVLWLIRLYCLIAFIWSVLI